MSVVLRQYGSGIEIHAAGGSGDESRSYLSSCRSESAQEQIVSIISRIIVRVSPGSPEKRVKTSTVSFLPPKTSTRVPSSILPEPSIYTHLCC